MKENALPILGGGGPVTLSAVLEPVAHLRGRQIRLLGQLLLLRGVRVRILQVPLSQETARALLEAVRLLLPVPDRPGHGVLLAHPVLVHRPQGSATQLLRLQVVGLEPQRLQNIRSIHTRISTTQ